jgi:hypothetical protein
MGAVRRKHEIDNGRLAAIGLKFGFENKGAWAIASIDSERRARRRDEPAPVVCGPEQGGKARGRIETRPA